MSRRNSRSKKRIQVVNTPFPISSKRRIEVFNTPFPRSQESRRSGRKRRRKSRRESRKRKRQQQHKDDWILDDNDDIYNDPKFAEYREYLKKTAKGQLQGMPQFSN